MTRPNEIEGADVPAPMAFFSSCRSSFFTSHIHGINAEQAAEAQNQEHWAPPERDVQKRRQSAPKAGPSLVPVM